MTLSARSLLQLGLVLTLLTATSFGQRAGRGRVAGDRLLIDPLPAGTIPSQLMTASGHGPIGVRGISQAFGFTVNAAVIFDSAQPTGFDFDLGAPNRDFGGPGLGVGGAAGSPYVNAHPLGKLFIIGENLGDSNGDGLVDSPDDADLDNSLLIFDFRALGSITITGATIIDVDNDELRSRAVAFSPTGVQLASGALPITGNNGVASVDIPGGIANVGFLAFQIHGSGGIADIRLAPVRDCNKNGLNDEFDIAVGNSTDVDSNGIPDDCQPDCNENGIPDSFDISSGASGDANDNGLPDDCEFQCDADGIPDVNNVKGIVWQDFNANGVREPFEVGIEGVTVSAYDCDNVQVATTVTDEDGRWLFEGAADPRGLRIEATNYPSFLTPGVFGPDSNTTVQFVYGESCDADVSLQVPAEVCTEVDSDLIVPTFVNGDPLAGGPSGVIYGLVRVPYGAEGYFRDANTQVAAAQHLGATWGTAYSRSSDDLYVSAVVRRHAGFGPGGIDAIYRVRNVRGNPDPDTNVSVWLNLNTLPGVNVGSIQRPDLPDGPAGPSHDDEAFDAVGKVGIGGICISQDERRLFAINLRQREVLEIDLATRALMGRFPIDANLSCSGGISRAFAVREYRSEVYIGVVCTAELSRQRGDLHAHVRRLERGLFVDLFEFPLTYEKGYVNTGGNCEAPENSNWQAWTSDWPFNWICQTQFPPTIIRPSPIFADIEFDFDGSMVLSFLDRHGMQVGWYNRGLTGDNNFYRISSGGDVLRAERVKSGWVLESNGVVGGVPGTGVGNSEGPGGGEFYADDFRYPTTGQVFHEENSGGGLTVHPGLGEIVITAMDPLDIPEPPPTEDLGASGGFTWLSSVTGSEVRGYLVYKSPTPTSGPGADLGTFGKGAGLGDPSLLCEAPPIHVGNLVFADVDGNGIQTACDLPIPGVVITLHLNGTLVATDVTSEAGQYFFDETNVPNGIDPLALYDVRISLSDPALGGMVPTLKNIGGTQSDSNGDPNLVPNFVTATLTTSFAGVNDHSIDFGFTAP